MTDWHETGPKHCSDYARPSRGAIILQWKYWVYCAHKTFMAGVWHRSFPKRLVLVVYIAKTKAGNAGKDLGQKMLLLFPSGHLFVHMKLLEIYFTNKIWWISSMWMQKEAKSSVVLFNIKIVWVLLLFLDIKQVMSVFIKYFLNMDVGQLSVWVSLFLKHESHLW